LGLNHSPRIVTDGLVLCLDAANRKSYPGSGNTWFDLSNRGNNGTLINSPTLTTNYFQLNGTNQRIDCQVNGLSDSNLGDRVAFECFCYGPMSNSTMLMSWGSGVHDIFIFNGGIGFNTYSGDVYGVSTTGLANVWNHFVLNFYRNNYTLSSMYINGSQRTLSQIAGTQTTSNARFANGALQIGSGGDNNYYGNWRFSTVKVYNRALSEVEIRQNFNALRGRYGI
jgi:hypothetical protein